MSDTHNTPQPPAAPSLGNVLGALKSAMATPATAPVNPNPNGATRPATPATEPKAAPVTEGVTTSSPEPEAPAPEAAQAETGTDAHEGEPLPAYLDDLAKGLGLDVDDILNIKHKVKVDGQEVEATLAELTRGYSRQSDYERNSGSLKQKHEAFETQRQAWETERQNYVQTLTQLYGTVEEMAVGKAPDPVLLDPNSPHYNPDQYHRDKALHDQRSGQYRANMERLGQMTQAQQQETARRLMDFRKTQEAELHKRLPVFADKDKGQTERKAVVDFLKNVGFSDEEIGGNLQKGLLGLIDARQVEVAWKAAQWDRMEKSKAKLIEKKVEGKPKYIKPGTMPNKGERAAESESALAKQLQANPRDRNAAMAAIGLALKKKA